MTTEPGNDVPMRGSRLQASFFKSAMLIALAAGGTGMGQPDGRFPMDFRQGFSL